MSEKTQISKSIMGLDTVRLRSPSMSRSCVDKVKSKGESHRIVANETDAIRWEITRTNLSGTHDARIMVRPMYTEWVIVNGKGSPQEVSCPPYLLVECSLPKAFYGQNVYGTIADLQQASGQLQQLLEKLLGIELPSMLDWRVQRADWAENFALPYQAIQEYFDSIPHAAFPRRKTHKYGNQAIYVPGTTTTIKFYHKGPEFDKNERKRLFHILKAEFAAWSTIDNPDWAELHAQRMTTALQRLANTRLRVEVEIHAEKLDYDFGMKPKVSEIPLDYFPTVYDKEVQRLLREGANAIDTARTARSVHERLKATYSPNLADILHGFWGVLSMHGEDYVKANLSRATFYRRRSHLVKAGVSWHTTDVQLIERQGALLPADFSPIRANPRRCESPVRERHAFNYERELVKLGY